VRPDRIGFVLFLYKKKNILDRKGAKKSTDKFDEDPIMQIVVNIYKNFCFCVLQIRIRTDIYIYIFFLYLYVCVYVCVCTRR
jgi:hypothetical protein